MAELTVKMPENQAPSFLGYSQPTQAGGSSSTFGTSLLKDAANLTTQAAKGWETFVQTSDAIIKDNIGKEAIAAVDRVRQTEGVNDAATITRLLDQPSEVQVPETISAAEKNLKELYGAKQQGKISDTTYWARLDNVARDLRSRYPEYREYIDNKLQTYTGATPANRVITGMIHDANNAAALANKEDSVRNHVLNKLNEMGVPTSNLKGLSIDALRDISANKSKIKYDMEVSQSTLQLASSQNKMTKELASTELSKQTQIFSDSVINDFLNSKTPDGKTIQQKFDELNANPNQGPLDEASRLQLVAHMNEFRSKTIEKFKQERRSQFKSFGLSEKDFEEGFSSGLARFNAISDSITGGKYDQLSQLKAREEAAKINPRLTINLDPRWATVGAIKDVAGDQIALLVKKGMDAETDPQVKTTMDQAAYFLFSKQDLSVKQAWDEARKLGLTPERQTKVQAWTYDTTRQMLTNPGSSENGKRVAFNKMFGNGQEDFIQALSKNERVRVFKDLVSDTVSNQVSQLGTDAKNQYEAWIRTNLPVALRQTLQDAKGLEESGYWKVQYNNKTQTFEIELQLMPGEKPRAPTRSLLAENLSTIFQGVTKVIEGNGKDANAYLRNVMLIAGFNEKSKVYQAFKEQAFKDNGVEDPNGPKDTSKLQGKLAQ